MQSGLAFLLAFAGGYMLAGGILTDDLMAVFLGCANLLLYWFVKKD